MLHIKNEEAFTQSFQVCPIFIYGGAKAVALAYSQARDQVIRQRPIARGQVVQYCGACFFLMRTPGREPCRIKIA